MENLSKERLERVTAQLIKLSAELDEFQITFQQAVIALQKFSELCHELNSRFKE